MTSRCLRLLTAIPLGVALLATPEAHSSGHEPLQAMPPGLEGPAGGFSSAADAQSFREEATDRQTKALPLGPAGSLELTNISGSIECLAGSGPDVSVEVIRRARGRTDADARLGLAEVQVEIDRQGDRASVVAVYPDHRRDAPYSVDVSYVVTAPPGTRLTISSVSGDVTTRNIKGDQSVTSVSGDVHIGGAARLALARSVSGDVTVLDAATDGGVSASSVSGDVRFDAVRAARLDAQTVSGSVAVSGATARAVTLKSTSGDVEYQGAIQPGGRYEFTSHSGDLRIGTPPQAGFELQASTFSGDIRVEPGPAMTRQRGLVRTTIGDGSALIVTKTFSGTVTVVTR